MDIMAILDLISNVGFPIAVCLLMFRNNEKVEERHREEILSLTQTMEERRKEDTEQIVKSIDNNTAIYQKLIDKIDGK